MISLAQAIANYEGYGSDPNNIPTRDNNPGDIVYGSFAAGYGATKDPNSQFAVFPDATTGFQAENDLLSSPSYAGLSIADAIAKWNGQGANSGAYANYVASQTGASLSDTVGNVINQSGLFDSSGIDGSFSSGSGIDLFVIAGLIGVSIFVLYELI